MKQKSEALHFQLPNLACWQHTWQKPVFDYLASDHFNGERFSNALRPPQSLNRNALFKWLASRQSSTWKVDSKKEAAAFYASSRLLPQERPDAPLQDWQVWFVGHATVLIQIGPYNFLTDPVWSEYASHRQGLGPKRV